MPVWHEATKQLQAEGTVQMVGIIQEQHADRCALFMQWKGMDWPIMVDSLNELEVEVVPITLLIDEHGIVRDMPRGRRNMDGVVEDFVGTMYEKSSGDDLISEESSAGDVREKVKHAQSKAYRAKGAAIIKWGDPSEYGIAIESFEQSLKGIPGDGLTHFKLGVSFRKRHDSEFREDDDFKQAVGHWQMALDIDPNQYIWRRRIQQYGPRLMKPYPFYDWVPTAREEIETRGETPVELAVEPSGAEYARPEREFSTAEIEQENPDSEGRIHRDEKGFIETTIVVVPSVVKAGGAVRVHVMFSPDTGPEIKAHWNNEVNDTIIWIDPPDAWQVDRQWLSMPRPQTIVSTETRRIEFELSVPKGIDPGVITIPAYALYYVCEDVGGACLYRRQDLEIEVNVVE